MQCSSKCIQTHLTVNFNINSIIFSFFQSDKYFTHNWKARDLACSLAFIYFHLFIYFVLFVFFIPVY